MRWAKLWDVHTTEKRKNSKDFFLISRSLDTNIEIMYSAKISTEVVFQIYIRKRYNTIVVIVVKDMVLGWLLEVNILFGRIRGYTYKAKDLG